jgi:hypothetical protein
MPLNEHGYGKRFWTVNNMDEQPDKPTETGPVPSEGYWYARHYAGNKKDELIYLSRCGRNYVYKARGTMWGSDAWTLICKVPFPDEIEALHEYRDVMRKEIDKLQAENRQLREQLAQAEADRDMAVLHMREPDDAGPHPFVDHADLRYEDNYGKESETPASDTLMICPGYPGCAVEYPTCPERIPHPYNSITCDAVDTCNCHKVGKCQPVKETPASKDTEPDPRKSPCCGVNWDVDPADERTYCPKCGKYLPSIPIEPKEPATGKATEPEPDPIREVWLRLMHDPRNKQPSHSDLIHAICDSAHQQGWDQEQKGE